MGYACPKCDQLVLGGAQTLLHHLNYVHNVIKGCVFTESVSCSQDGCKRTFLRSTINFKRHLEKCHTCTEENPELVGPQNANFAEDDDVDISDDDEVENGAVAPEAEMWDNFGEQELQERAAMFVASLLGSSSVPACTVTDIVQKSSSLVSDISSYTKYKVKAFAVAAGIDENDESLQDLLLDIDTVSCPFTSFETTYRQKNYFKNAEAFVQPEEIDLGGVAYNPCNNPQTGNVQQAPKSISYQYIPIKKLLKLMLEKTNLLTLAANYAPSEDNLMRDFHDGSYCRENEFMSSATTIKLIVYIDDFEVTNPLSPKAGTHKLGAVYCTIANVPPEYRCTLSDIFMVMLYNSSDVKMCGYSALFKRFLTDMKSLETEGLQIQTNTFNGIIHAAVAQVVGDNLGIHGLFGFAEGFTANYPCRHCRMHREVARMALTECKHLMRTPENYEQDLASQNLPETGIKCACPLNELSYFHVTLNRAPDVMHDMLEGVCPLEVHLILNKLIDKHYFTLETLNGRITSFNYGLPDLKNRPCTYTIHKLRSPDGSPGQNAGQMWCLVRHIALMLGDCVPEDDQHWELLLALLECMDIIFALDISKGETLFLEQLIQDHHSLFLELFPERHLKPKQHFMVHYPSAMKFIGPLLLLWVMRFEAKHNFSRRLSHIVCNFRNIAKTLAYRHQMQLCYNIMTRHTLMERAVEVEPGSSVILASLDHAEYLAQNLQIPLYDEVYIANWCKVCGTEYRGNVMVVVRKEEGDPVFGKVELVIPSNGSVFLLCGLWHTNGFNRHYHAYSVLPCQPAEVTLVKVEDLIDYYPLHSTQSYDKHDQNYYINMRHKV